MVRLAELAPNAMAAVRHNTTAVFTNTLENLTAFTFASRAESWVHIITLCAPQDNRHTTALRNVEQLKKSSSPSPPRYQGTERSVLNREGDTNISAARLSARNQFLLHCHSVSGTTSGQQHRS